MVLPNVSRNAYRQHKRDDSITAAEENIAMVLTHLVARQSKVEEDTVPQLVKHCEDLIKVSAASVLL